MKKYVCSECGKKCNAIIIDEGIGNYEYWGGSEIDICELVVSDCCDAPCLDEEGNIVEARQVRDDEAEDFIDIETNVEW